MKRGIFIGRFQPFHLGHLQVVHEIEEAKDLDEIIIGIGTSQCGHTPYNPFTSEERKQMIKRSLKKLRKPYHIIKIDDINNYPKWVSYVESLTPKFNVVYVGNTIVRKLFEEKKYEIRFIDPSLNISGTQIRQLIAIDGNWESKVPNGTKEIIYQIHGISRIKELNSKYLNVGVTTDLVIDYKGEGIVFIKRGNEPYRGMWALPGGFLEGGQESIEECAIREGKEETSLDLKIEDLNLIGVYSQPGRDPRGPTISVVFSVKTNEGEIKAGSDARDIKCFSLYDLPKLAFDHKRIIEDYFLKIKME